MPSIDGAYSPLKVFFHEDRVAALRTGRQPGPVHVQLIISDLCNQDCRFCAYRMAGHTSNQLFGEVDPQTGRVNNNPKRFIPLEKAEEILDDCIELGVQAIQITGGGEPTVHPQHREILLAVLDRGLDLALVTNGMVLRPGVEEVLLRAKWVRFSVDAGSATTYAATRRTSTTAYEKVLTNIRRLSEARRRLLRVNPDHQARELAIGVGFVVTKENWPEVLDAARVARDIGADNFRISAVFQPEGEHYFAEWGEEAEALCRKAEDLQTGSFRVFNLFGERLEDLRQNRPEYSFCGYQHFTTYIGADLNVYRCCNTAYSRRGLIGWIGNRRLKELWRSPEKEADFRTFDARACKWCQFNGKNRMILYAIEKRPAHVGFV